MKKVLLIVTLISSLSANFLYSQKATGIETKIFGGPELTYLTNGDNSKGQGMGLGFNGGVEFDFNRNKPSYFLTGLNLSITNINRWLDSTPLKSLMQTDVVYGFEVPVGIGFNLSKTRYKKFYTNWSIVNNFAINSSHKPFTIKNALEIQEKVYTNHFGFYTPGIKAELGHNFNIGDGKFCSISLTGKYMMWNWNKTKSDQLRTLGIGLNIGVIL